MIEVECEICGLKWNGMGNHVPMRGHVRTQHPNTGTGYGWIDDKVIVWRDVK